jgi:hypothetical protein
MLQVYSVVEWNRYSIEYAISINTTNTKQLYCQRNEGEPTLSFKNSQSTQRFTQMRQKKRSRPNPQKDKVTFDVKKFNNDGFFQLGGAYLPSEVIGCIMQFVPAYPYLLVLRRVSKQWCNELVTNVYVRIF